MVFKILHHFISEDGILREIKWLNKERDTPEEELLQWQWIPFGYDPIHLHFKSTNGNARRFDEGNLTFDHLGCSFNYYGQSYRLKRSK